MRQGEHSREAGEMDTFCGSGVSSGIWWGLCGRSRNDVRMNAGTEQFACTRVSE